MVAALRSAKPEEPLARAAGAASEAAASASSVDAGCVRNEIAMETAENFPGIKVGEANNSQESRLKRRAEATSKKVCKQVRDLKEAGDRVQVPASAFAQRIDAKMAELMAEHQASLARRHRPEDHRAV